MKPLISDKGSAESPSRDGGACLVAGESKPPSAAHPLLRYRHPTCLTAKNRLAQLTPCFAYSAADRQRTGHSPQASVNRFTPSPAVQIHYPNSWPWAIPTTSLQRDPLSKTGTASLIGGVKSKYINQGKSEMSSSSTSSAKAQQAMGGGDPHSQSRTTHTLQKVRPQVHPCRNRRTRGNAPVNTNRGQTALRQ